MTTRRFKDERYDDEQWLDDDADPDGRLRLVFTGGQIRPATDLPDIATYEPAES